MNDIVSKVKEKIESIDVNRIMADTKEKIEYLDMGNILGGSVRALEKIDVKVIKGKVSAFRKQPIVEKVENGVKAAAAIPVEFVRGFIGK